MAFNHVALCSYYKQLAKFLPSVQVNFLPTDLNYLAANLILSGSVSQ